jgi:predicted SAM-dependent methyltransferase
VFRQLVKRKLPPSLRYAVRHLIDEIHIARVHGRSEKMAVRRYTSGGLRLNLGSGYHPKSGWVNVDLFAPTADLRLDLRRPFPFPDGSATYIYSEHVFEHFDYPNVYESTGWDFQGTDRPSEALTFLSECRRVLAPGGALDLVVPDAEGMIGEYVRRADTPAPLEGWWGPRWCDTPMHCVNYLFRQGREHKYAYDEETLRRILETAGFDDVVRRLFDPAMDAPNHEIGSLCMMSRKRR